jgi:hypothetical protein
MKLSVNVITGGRYFRAFGDDVPDSEVPVNLRKYAVSDDVNARSDDRVKSVVRPLAGPKRPGKPRKGSKG